jgi:hypothetical protein
VSSNAAIASIHPTPTPNAETLSSEPKYLTESYLTAEVAILKGHQTAHHVRRLSALPQYLQAVATRLTTSIAGSSASTSKSVSSTYQSMQLALSTTRPSRRCDLLHRSQAQKSAIPTNPLQKAHQAPEQNPHPRRPATPIQRPDPPRLASLAAIQQSCLLLPTGARAGEGQRTLPSKGSRSA